MQWLDMHSQLKEEHISKTKDSQVEGSCAPPALPLKVPWLRWLPAPSTACRRWMRPWLARTSLHPTCSISSCSLTCPHSNQLSVMLSRHLPHHTKDRALPLQHSWLLQPEMPEGLLGQSDAEGDSLLQCGAYLATQYRKPNSFVPVLKTGYIVW